MRTALLLLVALCCMISVVGESKASAFGSGPGLSALSGTKQTEWTGYSVRTEGAGVLFFKPGHTDIPEVLATLHSARANRNTAEDVARQLMTRPEIASVRVVPSHLEEGMVTFTVVFASGTGMMKVCNSLGSDINKLVRRGCSASADK